MGFFTFNTREKVHSDRIRIIVVGTLTCEDARRVMCLCPTLGNEYVYDVDLAASLLESGLIYSNCRFSDDSPRSSQL